MVGINFKYYKAVEDRLRKYTSIFQIKSLVNPSYVYCIADGKFAIMTTSAMVIWDFYDTEKEVQTIINKDIRDEIMAIYEDTKENRDLIMGRNNYLI